MKYDILAKLPKLILIGLLCFFWSCKKETIQDNADAISLYNIIKNDNANFSLLRAAVDRAGLKETLENTSSNLTLLAPADEAFIASGLSLSIINTTDPNILRPLLEYHLIGSVLTLETSFTNADINSLANLTINITKAIDGKFAANGADITNPNKKASNGILHVVNRVLVGASGSIYNHVNSNPELSFLAVALRRASTSTQNVVMQLSNSGSYTLFAPNNAAFIAGGFADSLAIKNANPQTLANILTYHLLNTRKYTVDMVDSLGILAVNQKTAYLSKRNVAPTRVNYTRGYYNGAAFDRASANIIANNGVIHVINELNLPPSQTLSAAIGANSSLTLLNAAISRASQGNTNFTTLLNGSDLYTIIAPTNAAFIAAGFANVATINNTNPNDLAIILSTHILAGNRFQFTFRNNTIVQPLSTINLSVTLNSSTNVVSLKGNGNALPLPITKPVGSLNTNGILYTVGQLILP